MGARLGGKLQLRQEVFYVVNGEVGAKVRGGC